MRLLALLLWLFALPAAAAPSLQELIDAAPDGAEIVLESGVYDGPVVIDRPVTIDGGGEAIIDGGGAGWRWRRWISSSGWRPSPNRACCCAKSARCSAPPIMTPPARKRPNRPARNPRWRC